MISLITTFGCDRGCPSCIWKRLKSKDDTEFYYQDYYFSGLRELIKNESVFSISGGGDPLHEMNKHFGFWQVLLRMCKEYGCQVDIHTAYTEKIPEFIEDYGTEFIHKFVIHLLPHRGPLNFYFEPIVGDYLVRYNIVIDNFTNIRMLKNIESITELQDFQLSYRQLVTDKAIFWPDSQTFNYAKDLNKRYYKGKFIEQKDYNQYYWPDGRIKNCFLSGSDYNKRG